MCRQPIQYFYAPPVSLLVGVGYFGLLVWAMEETVPVLLSSASCDVYPAVEMSNLVLHKVGASVETLWGLWVPVKLLFGQTANLGLLSRYRYSGVGSPHWLALRYWWLWWGRARRIGREGEGIATCLLCPGATSLADKTTCVKCPMYQATDHHIRGQGAAYDDVQLGSGISLHL